MYRFLIFFLFLGHNANASVIPKEELRHFAFSWEWLSLYNYEKRFFGYKSKATEKKFFFSNNGKNDPLIELEAALEAFNSSEKRWGHTKLSAQCAFPARFERVLNRWPNLFEKREHCPGFENWNDSLGAKGLSILYVGPYPNNPASMFGHSLLRIKKGSGSWLLDYTVAFLANVDPSDGPVSYTFNGIAGGYDGFYRIEPYYMNASQYNNGESRDIWEYDLDLNTEELRFFIKHLWEVSLNTGFPYYFLDENCSYYLLTVLNAVSKRFPLKKASLLLHPIETVKPLVGKNKPSSFRQSANKKINLLLNRMSNSQKKDFKRYIKNDDYNSIEDSLILDSFIEYMKTVEYGRNLSEKEKAKLKFAQINRSKLNTLSVEIDAQSETIPTLFHDPSKFMFSKDLRKTENFDLTLKWGYHGINDNELGSPIWSYIDYFGINLVRNNDDIKIQNLHLVDIYSMNPLMDVLPKTSWRLRADVSRNCFDCDSKMNLNLVGGWGLSQKLEHAITWQFINIEITGNKDSQKTVAFFEAGTKLVSGKNILFGKLNLYPRDKEIFHEIRGQYNFYFLGNSSIFFDFNQRKRIKKEQISLIGMKHHF